jgi:RES domain-containing protein
MLYASASLALACLELLVHLPPNQIPLDIVYSWTDLSIGPEAADFRGPLAGSESTRRFGQGWIADREAVAVLVPSVIVPIEFNVLLNPTHYEFTGIPWAAPQPFKLDQRLIGRVPA